MTASSPLVNASTEDLIAAVEENLFDLFRAMAAVLPDSEIVEAERLSHHLAFPHNPMFKGVWKTRLVEEDADDMIERTIAWHRERKAPFLFWWTGASTEPKNLGERLESHGLISMEEQQKELARGIAQTNAGAPCMVADLMNMNEKILEETPDGFSIQEIRDEPSLHDFRKIFVEVYGVPEWAGQAWVDATLSVGIGRTPWTMYLGRLDGEPVATAMLFNGGGVASVYAVGTLASARGAGIGGAITLQPLLEARDMGMRHAALFSTEMGARAYERIGFRSTEGRINRYLWRNESL